MKKIKIIAALSALVAVISMSVFLSNQSANAEKAKMERVSVIVARAEIPSNTVITEDMVAKVELPKEGAYDGVFNNVEDVVGKMTNAIIYANEPVNSSRIYSKETSSTFGLAYIVPDGLRGMSVLVDYDTGVSSLIKNGNFVDIIFSGEVEYHVLQNGEDATIKKTFTSLILQDIEVIAVDSDITSKANSTASAKEGYTSLTLALSPQDTLKLSYAVKNGSVWLTVRPQGDHNIVPTEDILVDDLVNRAKIIDSAKKDFER